MTTTRQKPTAKKKPSKIVDMEEDEVIDVYDDLDDEDPDDNENILTFDVEDDEDTEVIESIKFELPKGSGQIYTAYCPDISTFTRLYSLSMEAGNDAEKLRYADAFFNSVLDNYDRSRFMLAHSRIIHDEDGNPRRELGIRQIINAFLGLVDYFVPVIERQLADADLGGLLEQVKHDKEAARRRKAVAAKGGYKKKQRR